METEVAREGELELGAQGCWHSQAQSAPLVDLVGQALRLPHACPAIEQAIRSALASAPPVDLIGQALPSSWVRRANM